LLFFVRPVHDLLRNTYRNAKDEKTLMDDLNHSFTRWMFRPYLDLSVPADHAPYHLYGIEYYFRSFVEDRYIPHIHACFNPSFRGVLIRETQLSNFELASPLDLADALQSERWKTLCDGIRSFDSLPTRSQFRLAWTLSKLCFQQVAADMIPASIADAVSTSNEHAGLAFVRCYSRYRISVDDANAPYSIDEFKHIATNSPPGMHKIDSCYQLVVQNVKHHNNLAEVEFWQEKHLQAIEASRPVLDEFQYLFAMSRYHRVGGFIPQMRRQIQPMIDEMELAEQYALALPQPDDEHRIVAGETLYPVLESRTKEALWIKDNERALSQIKRAVDLSPYDARAWLQLGQVYVELDRAEDALAAYKRAARLAPPGREIAWFMAGQAYEVLGDLEGACDAYLDSLKAGPLGVSAAERLVDVATELGHTDIVAWVRARFDHLEQAEKEAAAPRAWPYKHLPPPKKDAA